MSTRSGTQRSVRYLTKYKHARNMYKNRVRFVKGPVPFQGKFFFFSQFFSSLWYLFPPMVSIIKRNRHHHDHLTSNRSAFMTLFQAATKSLTNLSPESDMA